MKMTCSVLVSMVVLVIMMIRMFMFMFMFMFMIVVVMLMLMPMVMQMAMLARDHDIKLDRTEIRSRDARHLEFITLDRQLPEFRTEIIKAKPKIQERADSHVSADAGEAVEVKRLHAL